jgi:hypothetical protein
MELEEGSGTEANDTALLEGLSTTELPLQEQQDGLRYIFQHNIIFKIF